MSAVPPEEDDDLTIRGDLENSSVAELLRSLLASGETGILTLRDGEVTKSIYIQGGRVVFAASTNPDERLGEMLLVQGKIGVRAYLEASKLIRPGRRLGAILVELDALEPEELLPSVEAQVKELLMELFTWTHGSYELVIKEMDPRDLVIVNIPTENLILEGIRRCRAWSQVIRGIGDIESVPVQTGNTDIAYKLDMAAEEQEILSHVNGVSTIEQICDVSYLSHFETCRILWALSVLGVVRRGHMGDGGLLGLREREEELDLEAIVEKFNQMFSRIYGFLRGRRDQAEVESFMDHCLGQVSRQYGTLFGGVDLRNYGRADYEEMLANVADLPAPQRRSLIVSGLNELVFVIQLNARTRYGKEEEAVISGIIKDGLRRMGPAR
jgi:Domain of unknown function (DUF4388)